MWGDDSEICKCKVKTNCGEGICLLNMDTKMELTHKLCYRQEGYHKSYNKVLLLFKWDYIRGYRSFILRTFIYGKEIENKREKTKLKCMLKVRDPLSQYIEK